MSADALHLRARVDRGTFVLDVDLTLPGQGVTVLFGPSGSGKTTCLRVLAGLESRCAARVSVGTQVWQDTPSRQFVPPHRRAVGYVFQEASLFPHLSVEGNLRFGFDRTPIAERRHDWRHGLDLLGIGHLLARWPHELSGGERQRVAIARALATSPRLLLMDEPLAALDANRKDEILPWLEQLHDRLDIPVVYVTHSLEEATRLGDHLVLLEDGRVRADGPAIELLSRPDLPMAHGEGAGALIEALACGLQGDTGLCELRFDGGSLLLPQTRASPLPANTRVRVRIQARDVSLSLVRPQHTSVLNCLPATVTAVDDDGPGQVLVSLRVGHHTRLLARISRLSQQRLNVAPDLALYAQIKAVAMVG